MKRRYFLTGVLSMPLAAAMLPLATMTVAQPAIMTFTNSPAITIQPKIVTFTPSPAIASDESGWFMLRAEGLEGPLEGPPPFRTVPKQYAVHWKHRHAIDLEAYGNELPSDDVLEAVTRTAAYKDTAPWAQR